MDQRKCCECHARIFRRDDNFPLLKRDWIISFWVFFPLNSGGYFKGWCNSAHLKDNPKPNEETINLIPPPPGYGMKDRIKGGGSARRPIR